MAEGILDVEDSSFDAEVLKADKPVLVDFWAPWCGPCVAMAPVLEELAVSYADKLKIVKFNVDDNPLTPSNFEIRSIPTLILFKDGNVADQIIGRVAKTALEESINKIL